MFLTHRHIGGEGERERKKEGTKQIEIKMSMLVLESVAHLISKTKLINSSDCLPSLKEGVAPPSRAGQILYHGDVLLVQDE